MAVDGSRNFLFPTRRRVLLGASAELTPAGLMPALPKPFEARGTSSKGHGINIMRITFFGAVIAITATMSLAHARAQEAQACITTSHNAQGYTVLHNNCGYDVKGKIGPAGSANTDPIGLGPGQDYTADIPGQVQWAVCRGSQNGPVAANGGGAWSPSDGQFSCLNIR